LPRHDLLPFSGQSPENIGKFHSNKSETYTMPTPSIREFDKISPTALLVAYVRQFSDIPYTQEIAALSHARAIANGVVA
jgi:hypothetical protein